MNPTKKNKLKSKYYTLFHGKIDKEIIDAVLASSNYNGAYFVGLKIIFVSRNRENNLQWYLLLLCFLSPTRKELT